MAKNPTDITTNIFNAKDKVCAVEQCWLNSAITPDEVLVKLAAAIESLEQAERLIKKHFTFVENKAH